MNNRNKQPLHPIRLTAAQKRNQAMSLRLKGLTFREIGEQMGISKQHANEYVQQALAETLKERQELADEVRQLTKERLDALLSAHWEKALAGSKESSELALKLIDRQAKLFGLDAPTKTVQASLELTELSEEELIQQARAMGVDLSDLMEQPDPQDILTIYPSEEEDSDEPTDAD